MSSAPLILCVDDNQEGLELRKLLLEALGYEVALAVSGAAALDFFAANPVEGVVLDYCMPEMDGGQVASHMRKLKPEVPILLLSGYARDIPPEVLATVDIYITKGSGGPALLQELKRLVPIDISGRRKLPQRAELRAHADKIITASRGHVERSREIASKNVNRLRSSKDQRSRE